MCSVQPSLSIVAYSLYLYTLWNLYGANMFYRKECIQTFVSTIQNWLLMWMIKNNVIADDELLAFLDKFGVLQQTKYIWSFDGAMSINID